MNPISLSLIPATVDFKLASGTFEETKARLAESHANEDHHPTATSRSVGLLDRVDIRFAKVPTAQDAALLAEAAAKAPIGSAVRIRSAVASARFYLARGELSRAEVQLLTAERYAVGCVETLDPSAADAFGAPARRRLSAILAAEHGDIGVALETQAMLGADGPRFGSITSLNDEIALAGMEILNWDTSSGLERLDALHSRFTEQGAHSLLTARVLIATYQALAWLSVNDYVSARSVLEPALEEYEGAVISTPVLVLAKATYVYAVAFGTGQVRSDLLADARTQALECYGAESSLTRAVWVMTEDCLIGSSQRNVEPPPVPDGEVRELSDFWIACRRLRSSFVETPPDIDAAVALAECVTAFVDAHFKLTSPTLGSSRLDHITALTLRDPEGEALPFAEQYLAEACAACGVQSPQTLEAAGATILVLLACPSRPEVSERIDELVATFESVEGTLLSVHRAQRMYWRRALVMRELARGNVELAEQRGKALADLIALDFGVSSAQAREWSAFLRWMTQ